MSTTILGAHLQNKAAEVLPNWFRLVDVRLQPDVFARTIGISAMIRVDDPGMRRTFPRRPKVLNGSLFRELCRRST
ncbi:MAG: hypothetical protein HYZ39_20285 [Mycolicibacterium cosmeticum]|nr:hypothetical protein [Mycolicibacterium cosmeticum]